MPNTAPQRAKIRAGKPYALNRSGALPRPNHQPADKTASIAVPRDATAQKKHSRRTHRRKIRSPALSNNSATADRPNAIVSWPRSGANFRRASINLLGPPVVGGQFRELGRRNKRLLARWV